MRWRRPTWRSPTRPTTPVTWPSGPAFMPRWRPCRRRSARSSICCSTKGCRRPRPPRSWASRSGPSSGAGRRHGWRCTRRWAADCRGCKPILRKLDQSGPRLTMIPSGVRSAVALDQIGRKDDDAPELLKAGRNVAGRSHRRRPSARTRPWVSGWSFSLFLAVLQWIRLPEPGHQFREGACFRLRLRSGCWCPALRHSDHSFWPLPPAALAQQSRRACEQRPRSAGGDVPGAREELSVASDKGGGKKRRSYRPAVEALESLRLLSNAAQTLPGIVVPHDLLTPTSLFDAPVPSPLSGTAWDTALDQTRLAGLLGQPSNGADSEAISSGIAQLNRYLSRAWYRAGVPAQMHDDCSQAVYVTLLQNLGRPQFDSLMAEIGQSGIRNVQSRETAEGPDFFRAVDTVKKRAQRERNFQPLDTLGVVASPQEGDTQLQQRAALREAIAQSLNPREAALINATLNGETPAGIASQWGVAPKTVSNEKTRVIQKLRTILGTDVPA